VLENVEVKGLEFRKECTERKADAITDSTNS
jgi:hypothetical protein